MSSDHHYYLKAKTGSLYCIPVLHPNIKSNYTLYVNKHPYFHTIKVLPPTAFIYDFWQCAIKHLSANGYFNYPSTPLLI